MMNFVLQGLLLQFCGVHKKFPVVKSIEGGPRLMNGIEINSTEILSKVPSSFSLILAETQLKEVLFACNHSHHFFHKLGQQKELATYSMIYFFVKTH